MTDNDLNDILAAIHAGDVDDAIEIIIDEGCEGNITQDTADTIIGAARVAMPLDAPEIIDAIRNNTDGLVL